MKRALRDALRLLALTAAALALHGYHLGVDDQVIYLPAIKKNLDPGLYPFDAIFFLSQTRLTLFDEMVSWFTRTFGFSLEWTMFGLYLATTYLSLAACLALARRCFSSSIAQWAAVTMICAVLPLHATGTLVPMQDRYLHPRGLATAAILFAVTAVLDRKPRALAWLAFAGVLHPQMAFFGVMHIAVLIVLQARMPLRAALIAQLPAWEPANPAWRDVMVTRTHHYPLKWPWYEWLGVAFPMIPLWLFARSARQRGEATRVLVCRAFFLSGSLGIAIAIVVSTVPQLERFVPIQFMRVLHLIYWIFFLMLGGWLGERFLRNNILRWVLCFGLIAAPVVYGYSFYYGKSPHIEWPGRVPRHAWLEAFDWIRHNTPRDALFAVDPIYLERPRADYHGFRALAERSMLADYGKDRGVVGLFPELAYQWHQEYENQRRWREFTAEDFRALKRKYGVTWVLLEKPGVPGLACPYQNEKMMVCRVE